MKWLLIPVLMGLCSPSVLAAQVKLSRSEKPLPERGSDLIAHILTVSFPGGGAIYDAITRKDSPLIVREKYQDLLFCVYPGGDQWGHRFFPNVRLNHKGKEIAPQSMDLAKAQILEQGKQTLLSFQWPVNQTADRQTSPNLEIRILRTPQWPDWLFLRISTAPGAGSLANVWLGCYPAATNGPKERERWVATPGGESKLTNQKLPLPAAAGKIALFNRYAQEDAGSFLVYLPTQVQSADIDGTYFVGTDLKPRPGAGEICVAVGFFEKADRKESLRRFFDEDAPAITKALASADWQPHRSSFESADVMVRDLAQLVKEEATPQQAKDFVSLRAQYQAAKQANAIEQVNEATDKLQILKKQLITQGLAKFLPAD